ncbi:hypothetical protein LguiA_032235 [Lonicera macranthoides]
MRRRLISRVSIAFLFCSLLISCFPEFISAAVVTLESLEIYKTHEWLTSKPTVYFCCKGENKTVLPDVKKINTLLTFKGEESWQPLTEFSNKKCKRCGFYEEDRIKSDDVFNEWEFCPSDFTDPHGKYSRYVEKEFNATFLCPECVPPGTGSDHQVSGSSNGGKGMHWVIALLISLLVSAAFIIGTLGAYKYWQKRKREKDQARFLQLFEDGDEIDDELGIGPLTNVI